jgi:hypothetical protein
LIVWSRGVLQKVFSHAPSMQDRVTVLETLPGLRCKLLKRRSHDLVRGLALGLEGDVSSSLQPGPPTSPKRGLCNATVEMPWACKSRSGLGHYWLVELPWRWNSITVVGWPPHASCGAVRQRIISKQLSNKSLQSIVNICLWKQHWSLLLED